MSRYALIAVSGPVKKSFTYRIPPTLGRLEPGQRVLVPFGRARKVGFYIRDVDPPPHVAIKDILRTIDLSSWFSGELFEFCQWIADYYFANPADCLTAALPPLFKKAVGPNYFWSDRRPERLPKELSSLFRRNGRLSTRALEKIAGTHPGLLNRLTKQEMIVERWPEQSMDNRRLLGYSADAGEKWDKHFKHRKKRPKPFAGTRTRSDLLAEGWTAHEIRAAVSAEILRPVMTDSPLPLLQFIRPRENLRDIVLSDEQVGALNTLRVALKAGFQPYLLHGVTGSGKTIVYCHLCQQVVQMKRTALVLTPEIALTSTTLAYFRGFFGDRVTVIHSAMTDRERLESWRGIRTGKYDIVVGPRSALFAPLNNLGVIIVDEEHDSSYKQDDPSPRFHGRDAAIMRARVNNIPIVLGSASPSIESYYNARKGRYQLIQLKSRPAGATLPSVTVVDMKSDRLRGDLPYLSYPLKKGIETRLARGEQVILYLNRRGHSPQLKCAECGLVSRCPNCRVNLTYHKIGRRLSCHYCGYLLGRYDSCPTCGSHEFLYLGVGTQKVEENIPRLFEGSLPARLDSDSATGRKMAYTILNDFAANKSNLLLGTQMVTKGLDFPGVTLVGVLSADQSLDWPDFRASEKAFAKLLQVAGRSGRSANPGEVMIQTYYPEHDVICDAARQDYETFFEREIASRKELSYPPFARIVNFVMVGDDERKLEREALAFRDRLTALIKTGTVEAKILGPAPCPMYRLRGRYRRHLFVKTNQMVKFVRAVTEWELREARFKIPSSIKVNVDVDPDDMM
ncbi:MAG: primosomal protein N' [Candidatus Zixiibacteriota bacterium]|nr:MAG: primosomal protein N' [candidate division Zixibacteria bacterium]